MAFKLAKIKIRNNHPSLHKRLHLARSVSFLSLAIVVMLGGYSYVSAAASGYTWADDEREFLTLVNNYRTSNGLGTLNRSGCATEAARAWSKNMATNNSLTHSDTTFFSNYCPSVHSGWAENAHYNGNVFADIPSVAFNGFKNSPGHNSNMLVSDWDQTGVGIFYDETHGKVWVTHIFIDCFDTCPSSVTSPPSDYLGGYQAVCGNMDAPSSVTAGEAFRATINIKNTGGYRWLRGPITIVSKNPTANNTWGMSTLPFALDGAPPLKPGWTGWFTSTNFQAPSSSGTYDFAWRIKHSSIGEFGPTCTKTITVTSASSGGNNNSNNTTAGSGTPTSDSNKPTPSQPDDSSDSEEDIAIEHEDKNTEQITYAPEEIDQNSNEPATNCCVEPGSDTGFVESVKDRLDTPAKVVAASAVSLTAIGSAAYGALHFLYFVRHKI